MTTPTYLSGEGLPPAVELTCLDYDRAVEFWNKSVLLLDILRQTVRTDNCETMLAQADVLTCASEMFPYMIAVMPTEHDWTWTWVKGRELAVERGVAETPPFDETYVFNVPDERMLDTLLAAYGDCERGKARLAKWVYTELRLESCRMSSTVYYLEAQYGPQPTWPSYAL